MAKSNLITSAKSKSKSKRIDRPFDPEVLRQARAIAEKYQVVLRFEDGEYYGRTVEFPGAMNDGKTVQECVENTIDITTTAVAYLIEQGQVPPAPASEERRDQQVNVRLSSFERLVLEEAARTRGYRGISDFMRAATLASVR